MITGLSKRKITTTNYENQVCAGSHGWTIECHWQLVYLLLPILSTHHMVHFCPALHVSCIKSEYVSSQWSLCSVQLQWQEALIWRCPVAFRATRCDLLLKQSARHLQIQHIGCNSMTNRENKMNLYPKIPHWLHPKHWQIHPLEPVLVLKATDVQE